MARRGRKWHGIKVKLTALITVLLCAAVAGGSWSSYVALKKALLATARDRIALAGQRVATALDQSAARLRIQGAHVAASGAVRDFLASPDEAARDRVLALFAGERSEAPQIESLELASRTGEHLVSSGRAPTRPPALDAKLGESDSAFHSTAVGPLVTVGATAFIYVSSPVIAAHGDTVGFVTQFRRVNSGPARALMEGLIGSDAELLFGNASGSVWTDLTRVAAAPPQFTALNTVRSFRGTDGRAWLGALEDVPHTPWRVWIQVPQRAVLAPARAVLFEIVAFSFIIVVVGAVSGWALSWRITAPLLEVSRAARAFAAGDHSRRAAADRADELGELTESFNEMAQQVQDTTTELELQAIDLESVNQELREGEARYRSLVELLPDGILVHADGEVLYANEAAARLLAASAPQQLLGKQVLDLVAPSNRSIARERITQNQNGLATPLAERALKRLDGTVVTVETLGMPFSYDGRAAAQTILRDVTERKHLEQQLAQSQKMEAVGRLAGGVAHDFNNLLTVITSYSTMALDALDEASPLRSDVEEIRAAASRAADLTRQLLAFSRKQLLRPAPLNLNQTVDGIDKMLRRLIGEDIELVTSCAADLDTVNADAGQIEQVIVNLAVNARDAMPSGGRLVIETANVRLSEEDEDRHLGVPPGSYVMLAVSDTGTGMSESTLEQIFEPFFTTKEPGKGTGLGLATVYGIVRQSGGDVAVSSAPGQGSTFRIYLPSVHPAASASGVEATPETDHPGSETLLVVEDDIAVRGVIARVLRRAGYTVLEAGTDDDALALCQRARPDIHLIITDLVMPGMGGRELARELLVRKPHARVLYMSGYTEDAIMRHRFIEREAAFIGKPFTPERLTSKVRELLDAA